MPTPTSAVPTARSGEEQQGLKSCTYSWAPAPRGGLPWDDCTGLNFLEQLRDGTFPLPAIACTLGWRVTDVLPGVVRLRLDVDEHLMHGAGIVHGGVLSTLLDSAMANAVITTLAPRRRCTTLQLNVNFLRPATLQVPWLSCEGRTVHVGQRVATTDATVTDDAGKVCATATSTYLLWEPETS